MKILCLHGVGQNASIMEALTSSIRYHLPNTWKYTFVDGENEVDAPSAIGEIFPGPYFCYYPGFSLEDINEQIEILQGIIEDEGPFEGFIGFSQGAALAATVLLHHERDHPFTAPPFRFAVCLAGTLPFSREIDFGQDVSMYFDNTNMEQYLQEQTQPSILKQNRRPNREGHDSQPTQDDNRQPTQTCRMLFPSPKIVPIQVPSVHVYGAKDGWLEQCLEFAALFDSSNRSTLQHDGGHEIPSSPDVMRKICKMIEVAATKSELQQ